MGRPWFCVTCSEPIIHEHLETLASQCFSCGVILHADCVAGLCTLCGEPLCETDVGGEEMPACWNCSPPRDRLLYHLRLS